MVHPPSDRSPILHAQTVTICFRTPKGVIRAVDHLSLRLAAGEVLGIVGESGCGKSVLALSMMGLLPNPPAYVDGGSIIFKGQDLFRLSSNDMRMLRGKQIGMIFQEPMTALNPVFTIGDQLLEVFCAHGNSSRADAKERAIDMLRKVGVPAPERRMKEYPHQLSGGMRQRVVIAMALANRPALLLADEPTTALDVSIQAQILELMVALKEELGTAIILITHDLGVIAEVTQRVAVMYTGRIMEEASTIHLFDCPLHPYTQGLMASIPRADATFETEVLREISGTVPSLEDVPPGCHFAPRCSEAIHICRIQEPPLQEVASDHWVACWRRRVHD